MKTFAFASLLTGMACSGLAHAEPATYGIDPTHTFVNFEVLRHFNTSTTRGRFDKKEGTVVLDVAAKTGKVDLTIDLGSVSTGVAPLDTHLKSKDFFNVAAHPIAKFTSDKVVFNGDKVASVLGTLVLNGASKPVTLTASNFNCYLNPILKRDVCGGDFETTIARSQYGMNYGIPGIPDNIRLLITVEGIKQ